VDVLLLITELFSLGVTAEVLRANIDRKSLFFKGVCHFHPKLQIEEDTPHQPFVQGQIGQSMPNNSAAESFRIKKPRRKLS